MLFFYRPCQKFAAHIKVFGSEDGLTKGRRVLFLRGSHYFPEILGFKPLEETFLGCELLETMKSLGVLNVFHEAKCDGFL